MRMGIPAALMALAMACGTPGGDTPEPEPVGACGDREVGACIDMAQAAADAGDGAAAADLFEDACMRGRLADACQRGARHLLAGHANVPGRDASGANSPFGRALVMLRAGCDLGDAAACYELGLNRTMGKGVPKDLELGTAFFDRACALDHPEGCVDAGILRERRGEELAVARERYERSCELGFGRGCTKLGLALQQGVGGDAAPEAGMAALEKGCDLGWTAGCGLAAIGWAEGRGVTPDPVRRRAMLVAGARHGDPVAADHLLTLVGQGDDEAREALASVASRADAACPEEPAACTVAAIALEAGIDLADTPSSDREAASRYRTACRAAEDSACGRLGLMIRAGRTRIAPGEKEVDLTSRGCRGRHGPSCLDVGSALEAGIETEGRDLDAAIEAYASACALGETSGCEAAARLEGGGDAPSALVNEPLEE